MSSLVSTEGTQEHSDLSAAVAQIRDIITAVDLTVSKHDKCQELQEVLARLENKSLAKLKNGKVFRKQDLHSEHRDLQHKGLVYWKTATGRLKGVCACGTEGACAAFCKEETPCTCDSAERFSVWSP